MLTCRQWSDLQPEPRPSPSITRVRQPCNNCPWRVDAPRQHWDPTHFTSIWRNCQDDGLHVMACHKSSALPAGETPLTCQGWIRVLGMSAIGVRIALLRGSVTIEEVDDRSGPKLFPTFEAMLKANGIPLPARNRFVRDEESE